MKSRLAFVVAFLGAAALIGAGPSVGTTTAPATQCAPVANYPAATTPVAFWSTEARCAIVPAGPGGIFGAENFGNKFPGEAAVYMGIAHVALYDAAVAIEGATSRTRSRSLHRRARRPGLRLRRRRTTRWSGCSLRSASTRVSRPSSTGTMPATLPRSPTGPRRPTGSTSASASPGRSLPYAPTTAGISPRPWPTLIRPPQGLESGSPRPGRHSAFACLALRRSRSQVPRSCAPTAPMP